MTSYDTPYNRSLGRAQRLYDYADIDQDRQDIEDNGPLNGGDMPADIASETENRIVGGTRRGAELSDILHPSGQISKVAGRGQPSGGARKKKGKGQPSGGADIGDNGMVGGDFFNDLIGTVGNIAQTAGHLMPLFGLGQPSGGAKGRSKKKLTKGQMEKLLMAIAMRDAKRGRGLSGGDQIMDTDPILLNHSIMTNMGSSGKHNLNTNAVMGNGYPSGGNSGSPSGGFDFGGLFRKGQNIANQGLSAARGVCKHIGQGQPSGGGAGRYDMPELLGVEGMGVSGGGPVSDLGIPVVSQLAGLFGLGQPSGGMYDMAKYGKMPMMAMGQPSGGNIPMGMYRGAEGAGRYRGAGPVSDLGIPLVSQLAGLFGLGQPSGGNSGSPSGGQDPTEDEIMKSFLGGRRPSDVPKEEKGMLMRKALADAQLASEVKLAMERMKSGQGLSGGDFPMMERMVGGDFFNDLIGTVGNIAQTAGHIMPLFGLGQPSGGSGLGGLRHRLAGGAIEDSQPFNSPPSTMYFSNTPITGGGLSGGEGYDMEDLQRAVALNQAMSQNGAGLSGGFDFGSLFNKAKGIADQGLGYARMGCKAIGSGGTDGLDQAVVGGRMRKGHQLLLKEQMRGSSLSGFGQPSGGDQADLDYQPMKAEYETQGSYGDQSARGDTKGKGQPSGGKKPRGSSTRNQIVAKIMREKGMKLVEASQYVKQHNLYKK